MSGCRILTARVSALLLSLLCLSSAAAASVAKLVSFEKSRRCPTTAASLLPQKLTSELQCATICSRLPTCNAFQFNKNTGQCFHGDACSQLDQWTDGDCDSYKYTDVLCGDCDVAEPVLTELKLKLFYKFSRSGLKNEVNPRQSCLRAHDVTVDAGGAHFEGRSGSYLSTETPGFWEFFQFGAEFSAFARVRHEFNSEYQFYHGFKHCVDGSSGNSFAKGDRYISTQNVMNQAGSKTFLYSSSPNFLPADGLQREISVGFTFYATAHQHFYKNGSFAPVDSFLTGSSSYSTDYFDCLKLGYSTTDSHCLNGSMLCYGFSSKALSLSEFQQLQQLCDQD